jgi:hypothetical protein
MDWTNWRAVFDRSVSWVSRRRQLRSVSVNDVAAFCAKVARRVSPRE